MTTQACKRNLTYYTILAPSLLLLSLFVFLPALLAVLMSFYKYEVGIEPTFLGLKNYTEYFLHDPTTWKSFANMLALTLFAVAIRLTVPLLVAKLIFSLKNESHRYLYRLVFVITVIVPTVAVQMIWGGMIYTEDGLLNQLLTAVGLEAWAVPWLSHPKTVLVAIACIGFPFVGAFDLLIYYAGLSNIPTSLVEAGKIDGAGSIRTFLSIEVPLLSGQIKMISILALIGGIQGFEHIYILTQGGPGFESTVPGLWMYYNAFSFQRMGFASAIGVILSLVIMALTVINLYLARDKK